MGFKRLQTIHANINLTKDIDRLTTLGLQLEIVVVLNCLFQQKLSARMKFDSYLDQPCSL